MDDDTSRLYTNKLSTYARSLAPIVDAFEADLPPDFEDTNSKSLNSILGALTECIYAVSFTHEVESIAFPA